MRKLIVHSLFAATSFVLALPILAEKNLEIKENTPSNDDKNVQRMRKRRLQHFKFDSTADSYLRDQRTTPVCSDFLNHLNHPRRNELFNPDGSLTNESEKIKSVYWEPLDKKKFQPGFLTIVNGERPNVQRQYSGWYADPKWILQRAVAYPEDLRPKEDRTPLWLYRLAPPINTVANLNQPDSITWFPIESLEWLGDVDGNFNLRGIKNLGLGGQWFLHSGKIYVAFFSKVKDRTKNFFYGSILRLYVDAERNTFQKTICSFRSID